MLTKTLTLVLTTCLLLAQAGCSAVRRPAAPGLLSELADPAACVRRALAIPEYSSLSGIARIGITVADASRSYKSVFACSYPDVLRLEVLGLFNQPSLYISAQSGKKLTLYVPSENVWYAGPASRESMQRISGISMGPLDIIRTIHGRPPGPDPATSRITCTLDGDNYACTLAQNNTVQHIWINPLSGTLTRSLLYESGRAAHDIRYLKFQQLGSRTLPAVIMVFFEHNATCLEIRLQSLVADPVDAEKLLLQPPPDATVLPMSSFFTAE